MKTVYHIDFQKDITENCRKINMRVRYRMLVFIFLSMIGGMVRAQIIVTVSGSPQLNTASLNVTEAGNDFNPVITENQANTFINITNPNANNPNNYNYNLLASLAEPIGTLKLAVERTGNGTRPGSSGGGGAQISGGSPAIELTTLPQLFFSGRGNRLDVPIRFSLSNVSVTQPAGNILFSVIFTAIEQ